MALSSEIVEKMPARSIPAGHTPTAVTITLTNPLSEPFEYTVDQTGIAHASDQDTGMVAALSALKTWIDATFIPGTLGLDTTGNTVDALIEVTRIARRNSLDVYSYDHPDRFLIGVESYVFYGTVKWEIS